MFAITKKYQTALRTPVANFMVEKENSRLWGQMLYTGTPTCWMTPDPDQSEYEEANDEDTIFHLPSFIFDLNFTGETDIPVSDYSGIRSSSWPNVPAFSPGVINAFHAAPQPLDGAPILKAHDKYFAEGHLTHDDVATPRHFHTAFESAPGWPSGSQEILVASPWPQYALVGSHAHPPSHYSSPFRSHPTEDTQASVFHGPALQTSTSVVHAVEVEETQKLRVLEADIAHKQENRDTAESHLIPLPPSPPSRVFVPPPANIDNEITSPESEESVLPVSLSAHASPDRAVTAFRIIPTLPARFLSFFRSDADPDAQDTECAEDTFDADSEWEVEIAGEDLAAE